MDGLFLSSEISCIKRELFVAAAEAGLLRAEAEKVNSEMFIQSSPQYPPISPTAAAPLPQLHKNISFPILQHLKLSRRQVTICGNSWLLLLLGSQAVQEPLYPSKSKALAQDDDDDDEQDNSKVPTITKRAFLDIAIDGEAVGRIVIGLYGDDVPAGAAMFSSIVSGTSGISYRRKEFNKIMPNYVQHGGVRSFAIKTESNLNLQEELEKVYEKNLAGKVSIIVRDPSKPPPKLKLVARKGKLEIDQEIGTDPNGTEFVISIKDSPQLDASALVIGQVLEGMDVVNRIGQLKTVKENTASPYFRYITYFSTLTHHDDKLKIQVRY